MYAYIIDENQEKWEDMHCAISLKELIVCEFIN